jgi:hypothetical protein
VEVNGVFNGSFLSNPSFTFNDWYADKIEIDQALVNDTEIYSTSDLPSIYRNYYKDGSVTVYLGMSALTSSYHAENPSIYKGEPAYRLGVTSVYLLKARATWDYYQEWEYIRTVTRDVCRPGRNAEGLYDCFRNTGDIYLNGHTERVSTDIYGWGDPQDTNGGTAYKDIFIITTNKVRWPDGTIHDHIPILVYQSQPLLQKP